jgi:hypothetical protein
MRTTNNGLALLAKLSSSDIKANLKLSALPNTWKMEADILYPWPIIVTIPAWSGTHPQITMNHIAKLLSK